MSATPPLPQALAGGQSSWGRSPVDGRAHLLGLGVAGVAGTEGYVALCGRRIAPGDATLLEWPGLLLAPLDIATAASALGATALCGRYVAVGDLTLPGRQGTPYPAVPVGDVGARSAGGGRAAMCDSTPALNGRPRWTLPPAWLRATSPRCVLKSSAGSEEGR